MTEIRDVLKEDLEQIYLIEEKTFLAPWKKEDILNDFNDNPFSHWAVITLQSMVVGFYVYWHTFDSATIAQIAVDPSYQGQHYGSYLLEELISDCVAKKVRAITLEVRKTNEKALNLYLKYGFKTVTIKPNYYSNGDDAYYMVKELING